MSAKWEINLKSFLDNYKNACEAFGTESLTWLAYGKPAKKTITYVQFYPKGGEAPESLLSVFPADVELLGAEESVNGISKFLGLKFQWSLLKNISAQKLSQRLTTVKHLDSLSYPSEEIVLRGNLKFSLSEINGKSLEEGINIQIDKLKDELDNIFLVHDGKTEMSSKSSGTLLKNLTKDVKKEVALKIVDLTLKKNDVEDSAFQLANSDINSETTTNFDFPVIVRVNNDVNDGDAFKLFIKQANNLVDQLKGVVIASGKLRNYDASYYNLSGVPITFGVVFSKSGREEQTRKVSRLLNRSIRDFKPTASLQLKSRSQENKLLINPHEFLKVNQVGQVATVLGAYDYHHYLQDNFEDSGWGCAYRSFQSVWSWLRHQGHTGKRVPSHKDIQQCLVDIGDKPASFVGSKQWIGSMELSFCLSTMLNIESKILTCNSGSEIAEHARELIFHFENHGGPVMIGGGQLAHTILGVDYNTRTMECRYLVLDPHYTADENLHTILQNGWCAWKTADFWAKSAFYNLLLPLNKD